jgi:hypothetical protein
MMPRNAISSTETALPFEGNKMVWVEDAGIGLGVALVALVAWCEVVPVGRTGRQRT